MVDWRQRSDPSVYSEIKDFTSILTKLFCVHFYLTDRQTEMWNLIVSAGSTQQFGGTQPFNGLNRTAHIETSIRCPISVKFLPLLLNWSETRGTISSRHGNQFTKTAAPWAHPHQPNRLRRQELHRQLHIDDQHSIANEKDPWMDHSWCCSGNVVTSFYLSSRRLAGRFFRFMSYVILLVGA